MPKPDPLEFLNQNEGLNVYPNYIRVTPVSDRSVAIVVSFATAPECSEFTKSVAAAVQKHIDEGLETCPLQIVIGGA